MFYVAILLKSTDLLYEALMSASNDGVGPIAKAGKRYRSSWAF